MTYTIIRDARVWFDRQLTESFEYLKPTGRELGLLATILIPSCYIFDRLLAPNDPFDTLIVRIAGGIMSIPIIFYPLVSSRLARFVKWHWLMVSIYGLPIAWGLMVSLNAAMSTDDQPAFMFWWVIQYCCGMFVFAQLNSNVLYAVIGWVFSLIVVGCCTFFFVSNPNMELLQQTFFGPILIGYMMIIVLGTLTSTSSKHIRNQSVSAAADMASNISHELRTPLAGISTRAAATSHHLDVLVDSYIKSGDGEITPRQLELL